MKFEKGTKEWNMFGDLFVLLKKWTAKGKISHTEEFDLYMDCVKFGEKYKDDTEKYESISHMLAYDLFRYVLLESDNLIFSFAPDTEEKKMFTEFYFLCQTYWKPFVGDNKSADEVTMEDAFWNDCVRDFTEFIRHYFVHDDVVKCTLPCKWTSSFLSYIENKTKFKKQKI